MKRAVVEFITNRGPNTLEAVLQRILPKCVAADLQVAFCSRAGVERILPSARKAAIHGRVRLLTGLYQGITEPAALRLLLQAQDASGGRFAVRISREAKLQDRAISPRMASSAAANSTCSSRCPPRADP